jgi:hypothetical protein
MKVGYACGRYLMVRTTPLLMLWMMMLGAMLGAVASAAKDKAKTDDLCRSNR